MSIQRIGNRHRPALGRPPSGRTAGSSDTGSITSSTPILGLKMTGCFPRPDSVPWGLQRELNSHEETLRERCTNHTLANYLIASIHVRTFGHGDDRRYIWFLISSESVHRLAIANLLHSGSATSFSERRSAQHTKKRLPARRTWVPISSTQFPWEELAVHSARCLAVRMIAFVGVGHA